MTSSGDALTYLLAAIVIAILWWLFFSKMGWRGWARIYLVFSSLIPPIFAINVIALCFITWPVNRELRELKKK